MTHEDDVARKIAGLLKREGAWLDEYMIERVRSILMEPDPPAADPDVLDRVWAEVVGGDTKIEQGFIGLVDRDEQTTRVQMP